MDARSERREARRQAWRQAHRKEYEITPESEAIFYRGYEEVFGPLNNRVRKSGDATRKKRAESQEAAETKRSKRSKSGEKTVPAEVEVPMIRRVEMTEEAMVKERRQSSWDARLATTTRSTPAVTSEATPPVININNNFFYFGDASEAQVQQSQEVITRTLGQVRSVGTHVNKAGSTTDDGRPIFTILNVAMKYPRTDVHNAIQRLLSAFGISCPIEAITLHRHIHAMPRIRANLSHSDFIVPESTATEINAVLDEQPMCDVGSDCVRLRITRKLSYMEILEHEVLQIGWSYIYAQIAPIIPTINDKHIVYPLPTMPSKVVTISIQELLDNRAVIDLLVEMLNRPARNTIRDMLQR